MNYCVVANLRLGTDTIDHRWAERLLELCHAEAVDGLVLMNVCAASRNYRASMARADFISTLGPVGKLTAHALRYRLCWLLGPNDGFVHDPVYQDYLETIAKRGIAIHNGDFTAQTDHDTGHRWLFSTGEQHFGLKHPALHRAIRLFQPRHKTPATQTPTHLALDRGITQNQAITLHQKSGGKIVGIAHATGELPYFGQFGPAWCGSPGNPPNTLVINGKHPALSKLARV